MIKNQHQKEVTQAWIKRFADAVCKLPPKVLDENELKLLVAAEAGAISVIEEMQKEIEEYDIRVANEYLTYEDLENSTIKGFLMSIQCDYNPNGADTYYLNLYPIDNSIDLTLEHVAYLGYWSKDVDGQHKDCIEAIQQVEDYLTNFKKVVYSSL